MADEGSQDQHNEGQSTFEVQSRRLLPLPHGMNADVADKGKPADSSTWPVRWARAFEHFDSDNFVKKEQLPELLRQAGHRLRISPELIRSICAQHIPYPILGPTEAHKFMLNYEEKILERLNHVFESRSDTGGHLSRLALNELAHEAGFHPLPQSLSEVMEEAAWMASKSRIAASSIDITFVIFQNVIQLLSNREGFSKPEHDSLLLAFHRFDRDRNGNLSLLDIPRIMGWLGFCANGVALQALIARAEELREEESMSSEAAWRHGRRKSTNTRQSFVLPEPGEEGPPGKPVADTKMLMKGTPLHRDNFITLMRWYRAAEADVTQRIFEELDTNHDRQLSVPELLRIFRFFGMAVLPEVLIEAGSSCEINSEFFSFPAMWRVIEYMRRTEGLSKEDLDEARRTFKAFVPKGTERMSSRRVQPALQWLGICSGPSGPWMDRYGNRGFLCEAEFLKIVRDQFEAETQRSRETFRMLADNFGSGLMTRVAAAKAIAKINAGFLKVASIQWFKDWSKKHMSEDWLKNDHGCLDFEDFRRLVRWCRHVVSEVHHENNNFLEAELAKMRLMFEAEQSPDGMVTPQKLTMIFGKLFPMMQFYAEVRDFMKQALKQHGKPTASMNWTTFINVLRSYEDLSAFQEDKQVSIVEETLGLPADEVDELLDIFHETFRHGAAGLSPMAIRFVIGGRAAQHSTDLSADQVEDMRAAFVHMFDSNSAGSTIAKFVATIKEFRQIDPEVFSDMSPKPRSRGSRGTAGEAHLPAGSAQRRLWAWLFGEKVLFYQILTPTFNECVIAISDL